MKAQDYNISSEKFKFRSTGLNLHDVKLETKPVSYMKDALNRFTKNKGSIVATFIIGLLVLFAIIGPLLTPYTVSYNDIIYQGALPKSELCYKLGIKFWDGCQDIELNYKEYQYYLAIEQELNYDGNYEILVGDVEEVQKDKKTLYKAYINTYTKHGVRYLTLNKDEYDAIIEYQNRTGIQVLLPNTNEGLRPTMSDYNQDANIWFKTEIKNGRTEFLMDSNGKFTNIYRQYKTDENGKYIVDDGYNSLRIPGDDGQYAYANIKQGGTYHVRVHYNNYYGYYHQEIKQDGIEKPSFLFGANHQGKDLFTCLASGARFSFILAIIVATVNLFVGAIYGAIEGYYGGKVDLIMERFCDILGSIPFMIVITLFKYHLDTSQILILFISFFLTGWISMAGRTRMQFYRFKNQEYVLVARTLGARDRRIMFKHIFPNAIGTLITSCVLVIPSVIFSETSLSYLGIINLETGSMTSVGTLLSSGQQYLQTKPHMILFPSLFISLLMLSFNLFGNGLRDAFNPSLRGTED